MSLTEPNYFDFVITSSNPNCLNFGTAIATLSGTLAIKYHEISSYDCIGIFDELGNRYNEIQDLKFGEYNAAGNSICGFMTGSRKAWAIGSSYYDHVPTYSHPGAVLIYTQSISENKYYCDEILTASGPPLNNDNKNFGWAVTVNSSGTKLISTQFNNSAQFCFTKIGSKFYEQQIFSNGYETIRNVILNDRLISSTDVGNQSVFCYLYETGSWGITQILTSSTNTDNFAYNTYLSGNFLAVGAYIENNGIDITNPKLYIFSSSNAQDSSEQYNLIQLPTFSGQAYGDFYGVQTILNSGSLYSAIPNDLTDSYGQTSLIEFQSGSSIGFVANDKFQSIDRIDGDTDLLAFYYDAQANLLLQDGKYIIIGDPQKSYDGGSTQKGVVYFINSEKTGSYIFGGRLSEITNFTSSGGYIK